MDRASQVVHFRRHYTRSLALASACGKLRFAARPGCEISNLDRQNRSSLLQAGRAAALAILSVQQAEATSKYSTLLTKAVLVDVCHGHPMGNTEQTVPWRVEGGPGRFRTQVAWPHLAKAPAGGQREWQSGLSDYRSYGPESTHQQVADLALCPEVREHQDKRASAVVLSPGSHRVPDSPGCRGRTAALGHGLGGHLTHTSRDCRRPLDFDHIPRRASRLHECISRCPSCD